MKRSAVDVVVVVVAVVDVAVVKMEASKLDYDGDRSEEKKKIINCMFISSDFLDTV